MSTVDDVAGDQSRRCEPSDHTSRPSDDHDGAKRLAGLGEPELVARGLDDHVVGSPTIQDERDAGPGSQRDVSNDLRTGHPGKECLASALPVHDDQGASSDHGRDAAAVPGRRVGRERAAALGFTPHGPRGPAEIHARERPHETRGERRRDEYCLPTQLPPSVARHVLEMHRSGSC